MHPISKGAPGSDDEVSSDQVGPRHKRMTAYRCSLPVLTGLAGSYCAGPDHQYHFPPSITRAQRPLNREFNPAIADCGFRAPLPPRLARSPHKRGGDERIRTADPLVANEVLSQLSYIPTLELRKPAPCDVYTISMAERGGFEPPEQKTAPRFSRPPHSTSSGISPLTLVSLYSSFLLRTVDTRIVALYKLQIRVLSINAKWRRERDSNPR